jgi:hypothetical protein
MGALADFAEFARGGVFHSREDVAFDGGRELGANEALVAIYVITVEDRRPRTREAWIRASAERVGLDLCILRMRRPPRALLLAVNAEQAETGGRAFSSAQLGCLASHIYALLLLAREGGRAWGMIAEDDVILHKDFHELLPKSLRRLPPQRNLALLGYGDVGRWRVDGEAQSKGWYPGTSGNIWGCFAMAIRTAAAESLANAHMTPPLRAADERFREFDAICVYPPLALPEQTTSFLGSVFRIGEAMEAYLSSRFRDDDLESFDALSLAAVDDAWEKGARSGEDFRRSYEESQELAAGVPPLTRRLYFRGIDWSDDFWRRLSETISVP